MFNISDRKIFTQPPFFPPAFQHNISKGDISQAHHFVPSLCNKLSRLLRFYEFVVCMPTNKKEMKMHLLALASLFRAKIVDRGRGKKEKKQKKMCVVTSYERLLFVVFVVVSQEIYVCALKFNKRLFIILKALIDL